MVELSDPATELAGLLSLFFNRDGSNNSTINEISSIIGIDPGEREFYLALSAITERLSDFRALVSETDDDFLSGEDRENVKFVADRFVKIFHPLQFGRQWKDVRSEFLQHLDATLLRMYAPTARRVKPLRAISVDKRDEIISQIDKNLESISNSGEMPIWAAHVLKDGLDKLRVILIYLPIFGHDAAIDQLLVLKEKVESVGKELNKCGDECSGSIKEMLVTLVLCVDLLVAPLQVYSAGQTYMQWTKSASLMRPLPAPEERRLLAPPNHDAPINT